MEIPAARLLFIFLLAVAVSNCTLTTTIPITTTTSQNTTTNSPSTAKSTSDESGIIGTSEIHLIKTTSKSTEIPLDKRFLDYVRPFSNARDILLEEIQALDADTKIQKEMAATFKAEAERDHIRSMLDRLRNMSSLPIKDKVYEKLKTFDDVPYDELNDEEVDDEAYDDDTDDLALDDDDDDDDDDDEEVMTQCPNYCRCSGQYATTMTATCTKFVDDQSFRRGITHLRIENAEQITLGPNALQTRGLLQLESITITDTRIVELDRMAFNGITYLFAVNLTRNGLQDIHPNTFQNNTQLGLLTIAGNPLKHVKDSKTAKHYLLHAPSVTDFDFSNNGILRLKRTAFSKMESLGYINLRGNRLREIDSMIFDTLDSLVEVDLSYNLLSELPIDIFDNKGIQTLRISGNTLTTLATIIAPKLTILDASENRIKIIAKEDLDGVPLLEQLYMRSNNLKRIHQHAFSNLDQLTYLDISDNKLSMLTDHHFRGNPRLQVLLMSDNPGLQTLPVFKVTGLEYDTFSVYRFECANCGLDNLQPGTFDEMPAITRLNLAKNRLNSLPDGILENLSSLREFDLSDNIISTLQPEMFRGAHTLNKLNLARNPLRTLQVMPFLNAPGLTKLDVSQCSLERVWSEARVPLKSLRFLSVRGNLLRRITVEELKATPKLTGLDLSHNPLDCDAEFHEAVQWLTDHGVTASERLRYASDFANIDDDADVTDVSQWADLANIVCDGIDDGPPPRRLPGKKPHLKDILMGVDNPEDDDSLLKTIDTDENLFRLNHGMHRIDDPRLLEDQTYDEDFTVTMAEHSWQNSILWLVITVIIITLAVFLLTVHFALCMAKKRGRSPVLRPPMILRQGLVDNKNCGLVYKPLHEEIATPHMPKRGSFYSSSAFHYDKILPESV